MKKQKLISLVFNLINDSNYFLLEAEKLDAKNISKKERLIRASILTAWAGFEGWINKTAFDFAQSMSHLSEVERGVLMEKRVELKNGKFLLTNNDKYESTENKMEFLVTTVAGRVFDKSNKYWKDFKEIKKIRDSIVHPKMNHRTSFNETHARMTISTLRYYQKLLSKKLYK